MAAKVAELLRPLLPAPGAVARFARAGLLPDTILAATGFSGLLAGRTRLTGEGRLNCKHCKAQSPMQHLLKSQVLCKQQFWQAW